MTREDVRKLFPEATDEQITSLLNQSNSEIAKEKAKNKQNEAKLAQLESIEKEKDDLQSKLNEIEQGNLTEIEKANKALEAANSRIAELEKKEFISSQRADAVSNFKITADQAKEVVKDDGSFDMIKLGQIMVEKESAAALAKEQEIANASSNPGGQGGRGNDDDKSIAVSLVEKHFAGNKSNTQDILARYTNGGN